MKRFYFVFVLIIVVFIAGCRMPQNVQSTDLQRTEAAWTVEAELTRIASSGSRTPTASLTQQTVSVPTNTATPTITLTPIPCNKISSNVVDVTITDGTNITAGQVFVKTWRLTNMGTCTWTSSYQLIYSHGDPIGVPAGYAQALTAGTVAPGQSVDVSVTLTAPMAAGTYQGYWTLRDQNGQAFGNFWVKIQVPSAISQSITLTSVVAEDGYASSNGLTNNPTSAGDTVANTTYQAFVSFDISGIPINATITELKVDLTSGGYDIFGDPWSLGCLNMYPQDYGALDAGDYFSGVPGPVYVQWCNLAALTSIQSDNDFKALLQSKLGTSRLQGRLQLAIPTNGNGIPDIVRLDAAKFIVTYTTP